MADPKETETKQEELSVGEVAPADEGVKLDPEKNPLYPRVQELSQKNKDLQTKVDEYNEVTRKKTEEEALKRGDHEKIIEAKEQEIAELKPKAERLDRYELSRRQALKEELPEQFHKQVEALPLDELNEFAINIKNLNKGVGAVGNEKPGGKPAGEPLKKMSQMTPQERRDTHAQRMAQYSK